jgi:hypothetical protein
MGSFHKQSRFCREYALSDAEKSQLTYTDDVDLKARLVEWESFHNLSKPHGAFNGKAPYATLRERLNSNANLSRKCAIVTARSSRRLGDERVYT